MQKMVLKEFFVRLVEYFVLCLHVTMAEKL